MSGESNSVCSGFESLRHLDQLEEQLVFRATFSSNQKWNLNQSQLAHTRFSAPCVSCMCCRVLIGSLHRLRPLWLAIQKRYQNQSWLVRTTFPALHVSCMCCRVLINSLDRPCNLAKDCFWFSFAKNYFSVMAHFFFVISVYRKKNEFICFHLSRSVWLFYYCHVSGFLWMVSGCLWSFASSVQPG